MRSMTWTSRRRPNVWSPSSESSPLELDRNSYATFGHDRSYPRKERNSYSEIRPFPFWAITGVVVGAILFYRSLNHSSLVERPRTSPMSQWDLYHYDSSKEAIPQGPNLLIAQIAPFGPFSEVTSRPNRAYARRWSWDFLLHTGDHASCGVVRILNRILAQQEEKTHKSQRAPYDTILFLSGDAVIMDLDYQFLALLPDDKFVAMANGKADLFLWNLKHKASQNVARMWLDLSDDSNCDTDSLWLAIEMTTADTGFDASYYVQPLQLTDAGVVEPRLIKLLPSDEADGKSFLENMATLQSVADSVCYRYYPRCEVL